jgi:hypothetical protein
MLKYSTLWDNFILLPITPLTKKRSIFNPVTGKNDHHTVDNARKSSRAAREEEKYLKWLEKGVMTHPYKAAEIANLLKMEQRSERRINTVGDPLHESLTMKPYNSKETTLQTRKILLPVLLDEGTSEQKIPVKIKKAA